MFPPGPPGSASHENTPAMNSQLNILYWVASIPALAFIIHSPYTPIYVVIFPFGEKNSFTLLQRQDFPSLTEVEFVFFS